MAEFRPAGTNSAFQPSLKVLGFSLCFKFPPSILNSLHLLHNISTHLSKFRLLQPNKLHYVFQESKTIDSFSDPNDQEHDSYETQ